MHAPAVACFLAAVCLFAYRPRAIRWNVDPTTYHTPLRRASSSPSSSLPQGYPAAPSPPRRGELNTDAGRWFRDADGRVAILRGVNLAGDSKLPTRPISGETWRDRETLLGVEPSQISFVGRPFDLRAADEHLARLRAWGFTFLRLLVTWEAIEHAGPGIYDEEFLAYLKKVVRRASDYGIGVFIDPHQDVWSRFTGGSGAPRWTLERAGFDVNKLHASGAAFVHQEVDGPLPGQVWGHNYGRLATSTMFTLFFAGRDFAPQLTVEDISSGGGVENMQDFLQRHYCAAMARVARELQDETNVLGFDTLNEPNNGYVGLKGLGDYHSLVPFGWDTTPFQLMLLGAGFSAKDVAFYDSPLQYHSSTTLNPERTSAWAAGPHAGVWHQHGVWDVDPRDNRTARLLKPDHFHRKPDGSEVDFTNDYMVPFYKRFARAIRAEMPDAVIFAEPHINIVLAWNEKVEPRMPDATGFSWVPHYYDLLSLMSKSFRTWVVIDPLEEFVSFSPVHVHTKMIRHQLSMGRTIGAHAEGVPALIGETGICFDQFNGAAFAEGSDFDLQTVALDTLLQSLDRALASFTLWNYSPGNNNAHGDGWNEEDLSIFSEDQRDDPADLHSGGRALPAIVRPYASRIAGTPTLMKFDAAAREFTLEFRGDPALDQKGVMETVVFAPQFQYGDLPQHIEVVVSDGKVEFDLDRQTVLYRHTGGGARMHTLTMRPAAAGAPGTKKEV